MTRSSNSIRNEDGEKSSMKKTKSFRMARDTLNGGIREYDKKVDENFRLRRPKREW